MSILKNISSMASSLLAIFQTRIELFTVELQEEVQRLLSYFILAVIALFCIAITFALGVFLIIVLCWDGYRIVAICGLMAFFALAALVICLGIRNSFRNKPKMLAHTRSEIEKDLMRLKSNHGQENDR